jgi:NADH-quinone oxidoreductase subunit H
MALVNIVAAGAWHFLPVAIEAWIVCLLLLVPAGLLLIRALRQGKQFQVRRYRFAE